MKEETITGKKTLELKKAGTDRFGRPLFVDVNGRYYVDTDYQRHPGTCICTKYPVNDPEGEPDHPLTGRDFEPRDLVNIVFVESFGENKETAKPTPADIIRKRADTVETSGVFYIVLMDNYGDTTEFSPDYNYCEKCADKIAEQLTKELKAIGFDAFIKKYDLSGIGSIHNIVAVEETMPERDGFIVCDECGAELDCGSLYSFEDDIRCAIERVEKAKQVSDLSDSDCYYVTHCLDDDDSREKHPELYRKLVDIVANLKTE